MGFFCAGINSLGMNEERFTFITHNTPFPLPRTLLGYNSSLTFTYVSGRGTDSSEKGQVMWARVKGKTENDLAKLPFAAEYNFRPGVMELFLYQKNWKPIFKFLVRLIKVIFPRCELTMEQVGKAMINAVTKGSPKNIPEKADIKRLARV